ncbi:Gfo/Idh/MocA family protein [Paenibacillus alvei]|uniref:Gfo/Idh/MocA family protein n=1 Tax=Paenibacillus alvei TaxID=44250 RepID=UPI0013DCAB36|nr:Gfo/Idh/MocA family oxidoreductase [Paenibacillus alvei]NEZ41233.1 gfo/Idh/MocA family oxidoreductase [Paenibacillus alvei]
MTKNKIKLAIVGLGNMGRYMIRTISSPALAEQVELVAICEANFESREQYQQDYPHVKYYADYSKMLEEMDINLLYVSVPPAYHYDIVCAALRKKIHVFCEKPLANNLQEAAELLKLAEEAKVVHAIHFSMPHEPSVKRMEQMIKEHAIGTIRCMELILHFPTWPRSWQHNSWISTRAQGGFVLEVGVHWIHVIQKLFGTITHVQSELELPADEERCETGIRAKMLLNSEIPIYVDGLSGMAGEERVSLVIYGSEGTISLENWNQLHVGAIGQPLANVAVEDMEEVPMAAQVIRAIRGERADYFDFRDGYEAQAVLEALRHPSSAPLADIRKAAE